MIQDHFERHNHYDGVIDWNFNVTYAAPAVARFAEAYRPLLDQRGLYSPVPVKWLHATILRVGALDEYSEAEMLAVAEKVQEKVAGLNLPEFHFGSFESIYGNICFKVEPESALEELYDIVASSLEGIVGPERATKTPYGRFIAHTSLAYTKARDNESEVSRVFEDAKVESLPFRIDSMPLIRQRPTDGHYEWEVVADIKV